MCQTLIACTIVRRQHQNLAHASESPSDLIVQNLDRLHTTVTIDRVPDLRCLHALRQAKISLDLQIAAGEVGTIVVTI